MAARNDTEIEDGTELDVVEPDEVDQASTEVRRWTA
jgi:hypothetical protein